MGLPDPGTAKNKEQYRNTRLSQAPSNPAPLSVVHPAATSMSNISQFRRWQELPILQFGRRQPPLQTVYDQFISSIYSENLGLVFLTGCFIALAVSGLYGTASFVLVGTLGKLACHLANFQQPAYFLDNKENHEACMLVAAHRNAGIWYLYIGDRGVVDHLLNKEMVRLGPYKLYLSNFFVLAHMAQILRMTFVAANKSWDCIAMVSLMLFSRAIDRTFGDRWLARSWLDKHGVTVVTKSFKLARRTAMIAAIQKFSGSRVTSWIDDIITPCSRRDILLERLSVHVERRTGSEFEEKGEDLSEFDERQVEAQVTSVRQIVAAMVREFPDTRHV